MAGTVAGGKAAAVTNKKKYGPDFYAKIGAKGGERGRTGGFYANRELASKAGATGGRRSTRKGIKTGEGKKSMELKERAEAQRRGEQAAQEIDKLGLFPGKDRGGQISKRRKRDEY